MAANLSGTRGAPNPRAEAERVLRDPDAIEVNLQSRNSADSPDITHRPLCGSDSRNELDWNRMYEPELYNLALVGLAALFGAIVGLEREVADKPAGLRTHMFVCAAAAMLMLLSNVVLDEFQADKAPESLRSDPIRIIQAIVVGISFLGAGTIIHQGKDRVEGLTTAASILLTAGVGIAVAVGQFVFAGGTAIMAVVVLLIFGWAERRLTASRDRRS